MAVGHVALSPSARSRYPKAARGKGAAMKFLTCIIVALALAACSRPAPPLAPARAYHPSITRDQYGVPTIHGHDDAEAAYGLAMAHAEDNFRTIQLVVLAARGRLGAYLGEQGAKSDFLWNLLDVKGSVERGYERDLSPAIRAIFTGYADGLNAYGRAHPGEVLPGADNITGRDVAAGSALTLPLFWGFDSILGRLADEHGHPCATRQVADAETIDWGSNAFAVAPSRSADHHTRVILNSHQPWDGPVAWYEARIESDSGWRMHGGLFPGAPFPVVGGNGVLGWAATVNLPDLADLYRLQTDAAHPGQYVFDGQWRKFDTRVVWLNVKIGPLVAPIPKTLTYSVQGPAFHTADGWVAVRYAGPGELRALQQFYEMGRAQNFDQWRTAMAMRAIPSFNFVYGDASGRIAYFYNANIPRRPAINVDWSGCVAGDTSATLWDPHRFVSSPALIAPRSGWLFSANATPWSATDPDADMKPEDYPDAAPFIETYATNRSLRAVEQLAPLSTISLDQLLAAKFDVAYSTRSRMAEAVRRVLSANAAHDHELADIQRVLSAWDLRSSADSRGAGLANLMFEPLYNARRDRVPEPDPVVAARAAGRYLMRYFHRLDPPWNEVLRLRHGNVDLPMDGANDVLRGVRWSRETDGRLNANFGDGFMMVMDWSPDHAYSVRVIHQWGASSHETSPHYNDQSQLYVRHQWRVQDW
jgi:acyl-homoserine lactone acylase PvdQ